MVGNSSTVKTDDLVMGAGFSFLSIIQLILYIPCLIVIKTDPELKIHSCFKNKSVSWRNDDGILGELHIALLHVIAMNRFVVICLEPGTIYFWFSETKVKLWVAITWLYGLLWAVLVESPFATVVYIPSDRMWFFVDNTSTWVIQLGWFCDVTLLTTMIGYYALLLVYLRFKIYDNSDAGQTHLREKERRILSQAGVVASFTLFLNIYWDLAQYMSWSYAYAFGNLLWAANSGINPLVYLLMNKTISEKVKKMLGIKNQVATTANVHFKPQKQHQQHNLEIQVAPVENPIRTGLQIQNRGDR